MRHQVSMKREKIKTVSNPHLQNSEYRPKSNTLIVILSSYQTAEKAIHSLQTVNFNVHKVSVIGKDYFPAGLNASTHATEEKKCFSEIISFWSRIWGLLPGDAFFRIKGIGSIIVAGPMAETMRKAGTNPKLFHVCSPLQAAMLAIGISNENLKIYEAALQSDRFLVIVRGNAGEITAAGKIFKSCTTLKPGKHGESANSDEQRRSLRSSLSARHETRDQVTCDTNLRTMGIQTISSNA
jgi:hypothetical protein